LSGDPAVLLATGRDGESAMTHRIVQRALLCLLLGSLQVGCATEWPEPETPPADSVAVAAPAPTPQFTQQSPEQLDQLVAPIALYPDELVAQILAASSYPTEVVEAERWMQQHPDLKGQTLAQAVDQQSWDPSVKALTQFPTLLAMMDKNLSWTSALGDAYVNQSQNVLDAVQVMRRRAQQAGNLKSTPQETVTSEGQTIVIQPADPEIVYVPEYDPWVVYGGPLAFYPGWVGVPGVFIDGPGIDFGVGVGIGLFGGFGWGWHHWGADWHRHFLMHDHHDYISHSPTFVHRNGGFDGHGHFDGGHTPFGHAEPGHVDSGHAGFGHAGLGHAPGFAGHASPGIRSSAFGGFNHGGVASSYSSRGRASFGAGVHAGGFHGGGFHGGGFHGGGGHR
jgi:uncharacterized membrane protein YgcG